MNTETLASEMLAEIKRASKRWFIVALIELGLIFAITGGFLWYLNAPVMETETAEVYSSDSGIANYIGNDMSGVINNGGTSDGN